MTDNIEQKSSDILPCPFCGGEADKDHDPDTIEVSVYCINCGVDMVDDYDEDNFTFTKVTELWNTRASVNPWVPIGDIPDDFRDGHHVTLGWWLFGSNEWHVENRCEWGSEVGAWYDYNGIEITNAKYAYRAPMLPPEPPK